MQESKQEIEALNARTGKPVVKKDVALENNMRRVSVTTTTPATTPPKKVVNLDQELEVAQGRRSLFCEVEGVQDAYGWQSRGIQDGC